MATYIYPAQNVSIASSPAMFNLDGVDTVITEDTVVAANNKALPSLLMIKNDAGIEVPVTLDQTNPYTNNVPIPVAITDVTGSAVVNITAGDINVSIKHNGADPSSVRVGDGTTLAGVTLSNELKTKDAGLPSTLGVKTAVNSTSVVLASDGSLPLPSGAATEATLLKIANESVAELISGDYSTAPIDNVTGVTLVVPTAGLRTVRLAQNGGADLIIFNGATRIGVLEKGGVIVFNQTFDGTNALVLKNSAIGSATTNVSWNLIA